MYQVVYNTDTLTWHQRITGMIQHKPQYSIHYTKYYLGYGISGGQLALRWDMWPSQKKDSTMVGF